MSELLQKIQSRLNAVPLADNLTPLFCETLHWGAPRNLAPRSIAVGAPLGRTLTATPVAQLTGLPVFRVDWPEDRPPTVTARRAVQRALAPVHAEHLLCYLTRDHRQASFVRARKRPDGKIELRTLPYEVGSPARTTIERLGELAFRLDELGPRGEPPITAVADKLNAAFDVEAVTKKFFTEIANWYFWACDHVEFPTPKGIANAEAYKAQSLIRLITRLIFCWFVKEKGLIPDDLFQPRRLAALLKNGKDLATGTDTTYYKAILQNLFFATLNQEMGNREFRKRHKDPQGRDPHRGITNLYRYQDAFADPAAFLALMCDIPFLNGGLFECLDKVYRAEENLPDVRIDGFSDQPKNPLSVPDFLFFGDEREVDLSAAYGEARYRHATVRGLIHTFCRYNFTITENTPLDQEVALDPELSGKVFENLLAAYNPETATTARKQTGSFYTPREIVDYMVDEALIACLKGKLTTDNTDNTDKGKAGNPNSSVKSVPSVVEQKLRHLFAYNDEPHQFTAPEVDALIAAIDSLKSLDPAVGSGAFPMGILHKLVFILGKLDPRNERWKERQIARVRDTMATAEKIEDATARERTVRELEQQIAGINEAFEHNELDYGRKLYLIENCIYGVDIQPIAVQIAKMRFFISLIVDQKIDDTQPNRGVRPLPNLETKFVAANSLIGVNRPGQQLLRNRDIDAKEAELRRVRQHHFDAKTPKQKAKCRDDDARLRAEIAELLKGDGWDTATARKLASWNPYDQNTSADFFDSEWMFGITDGFDVATGNPPYIFARNSAAKGLTEADKRYFYAHYALAEYQVNLYPLFVEKGTELLSLAGILCFITPNNWLTINTNKAMRKFILGQSDITIVNFYARVFESADVDSSIIVFRNCDAKRHVRLFEYTDGLHFIKEAASEFFLKQRDHVINIEAFKAGGTAELMQKIEGLSMPLSGVANVKAGLKAYETGCGTPAQTDEMKKNRVYHCSRTLDKTYLKYFDGKDVCRYYLGWSGEYLKYGDNLAAPRKDFRLYSTKRILVRQIPGKPPYCVHACVTDELALNDLNSMNVINIREKPEYVLGVLNSRLVSWWFVHKFGKMQRETFPQFKVNELADFPLPKSGEKHRDQIAELVERILEAKRADPSADTTASDREIDDRVYRLYNLTAEEIKLVEGGTK